MASAADDVPKEETGEPLLKRRHFGPLAAVKTELCDADVGANMSQKVVGSSLSASAVNVLGQNNRRALLMKFIRTREPAKGKGTVRTEKCPEDIAAEISKCPLKRNHYFDLWVGCGQSWGKVVLFEKTYRKQTKRGKFKEQWLTKDQLIDHYKNETVVDAIIKTKTIPESKRQHPEACPLTLKLFHARSCSQFRGCS